MVRSTTLDNISFPIAGDDPFNGLAKAINLWQLAHLVLPMPWYAEGVV